MIKIIFGVLIGAGAMFIILGAWDPKNKLSSDGKKKFITYGIIALLAALAIWFFGKKSI